MHADALGRFDAHRGGTPPAALPRHAPVLPRDRRAQLVSRHTVKSHAVAVYRKLNVSSRTGAVERARELGLLC